MIPDEKMINRCDHCYSPRSNDVPHTVEDCIELVKHQRDVALNNVNRGQVLLTQTELARDKVLNDLRHLLAMSPCTGESEYCLHESVKSIINGEYRT